MKQYEITFITTEDLGDKPAKEIIEKLGGKVLNVESLGEKQLAYKIKKQGKGFYTTCYFELAPEKIAELNKKLSLEEEILRFLIVITASKKEEARKTTEKTEKPATSEEIKEVEKEIAHPEQPIQPEEMEIAEPVETELVKEEVVEKPKKVKKAAPKKIIEKKVEKEEPVSPDASRGGKVEEIVKEEAIEEDRLKTLDEKLDELLKE